MRFSLRVSPRSFPAGSALLLAAIACGGLAMWAAHAYLQGQTRQLQAMHRVPTVERLVAAHDLVAGTKIDTPQLALRAFPLELAPSDSLDASQAMQLLGTVLRSELRAGDIIVPAHTQQMADAGGLSSRLSSGRRAVTLPVDAISSVSGLLQPGDLIDLYVSFDHQRRRVTAPLLQGVLVLATGNATRPDASIGGYATITLDTSPEDAVKLVAARQGGTITAMLRAAHDSQTSQRAVRGDLAGLLGLMEPAVVKPRKPVVLYGNQAERTPPALQSSAVSTARQGMFDLPEHAVLASAWRQISAASTAAAQELAPEPQDGDGSATVMQSLR